ncbi:E3 ubiquitin- ligase TRIP12-like isoform X4 [Brachionus plicatilis]|uniref:E3 ubiquitin-protein ligase n=1 Tax=Brachionus plicatilis TaxID=10195 RepID=A0A3M7S3Z3_BRAPC|nr:E3 ubiquitin- ligase TRIP12-like isoform X4 [Brachionus plicatilis]
METGSCAAKSVNLSRRPPTTSSATTSQSFESNSIFSRLKTSKNSKMSEQKSDKAASSSSNSSAASTSQAKNAAAESESSDTDNAAEFSRLSDLLQSRGLPSHIVNAFGSKVHQFIHRTMSSGMSSRYQQLVSSLQQPDESIKLSALTELSQLLVMSNEDSLIGFPIKQAVPLVLQCMSAQSDNFELMNHACRTLTYMMDALPRSTSIIAESVATFLQKLQVIQCMDVAEQSLTALEILSRRHSKQILNATSHGSVSACLTYLDFFSMTAQRNALQITANCCQNMIRDEFVHIKASLAILAQRLTHADKKSVESVCTVFARLVENFQHETDILGEIARHRVLQNLIELLMAQPPLVSSSMFVTILHTIYLMCSNCDHLATILVEESSIEQCLTQLLIGDAKQLEIVAARSPQELYEIVCIIGEMLPRLPHTGIFAIDEALRKASASHHNESVTWHWKDENDIERPYTGIDSRIIEAAYVQEEDECILNTMGRTYVIDFNSMLQINEETGTARPVSRKLADKSGVEAPAPASDQQQPSVEVKDTRVDYLLNNAPKVAALITSLFKIVYEIYNSSAGPALRHRSLRSLLRMIYFACTLSQQSNDSNNNTEHNLLANLLRHLPISSHIAAMLANKDAKIVVIGLQMAHLLVKHLPDVFSVYFYREGVVYQVNRLVAEWTDKHKDTDKDKDKEERRTRSKARGKSGAGQSDQTAVTDRSMIDAWIVDQAKQFKREFCSAKVTKSQLCILDQLSKLSQQLQVAKEAEHSYMAPLASVNEQLKQTDISSFEMINSSLIERLVGFLSVPVKPLHFKLDHSRLKHCAKASSIKAAYLTDLQTVVANELNCLRLKQFLSVFAGRKNFFYFFEAGQDDGDHDQHSFLLLVSKLHNCVNQLEQFSIRVHDVPNSIGSGKNALKFFSTHQIKCMLEREASVAGQGLREWKGGHVKVDPLALVSTIEKYLLMRGIHKSQAANATPATVATAAAAPASVSAKKNEPKTSGGSKSHGALSTATSKKSDKNERESDSDNQDVDIEDHFDDDEEDAAAADDNDDDDEHIIEDNLDDEDLIDEDDDDDDDMDDMDDLVNPMSAFFSSASSSSARALFSSAQLPKIELLINDQPLPSNITIYQAIKQFGSHDTDNDAENSLLSNAIWSKVHPIQYRLASSTRDTEKCPKSKEKSTSAKTQNDLSSDLTKSQFYARFVHGDKKFVCEDKCSVAIRALDLLDTLNRLWFKMYENETEGQGQAHESNTLINPAEFCNQKLTAKANRQLQDPLIVMTGHLPKWLPDLITEHTFLFPFETRLMFFYQSYLDRDRAMQKLIDLNHSHTDRYKPRLEREKRTVNRDADLVKQADAILNELINLNENKKAALLEIQYENEVGTGLGPTLEFYALVSRELQKCEHEMWRGPKSNTSEYFKSPHGLYPSPIYLSPSGKQSSKWTSILNKQKQKFRLLGKFMAKAAQDFRVLDIHLSPVFYKWLVSGEAEAAIQEQDLALVDEQMYASVKSLRAYVHKRRALLVQAYRQKEPASSSLHSDLKALEKEVADLELDFTLPGYSNFELVKAGKDKAVSLENLDDYLRLVVEWTLTKGVQAQIDSFREGFESVLPLKSLRVFYADEMDRFFCGSSLKKWDPKSLTECTRCDHGYTHESSAVKYLFEVMCQFDADEQRMFLQFVTGSPRLPIGGLSSLSPALTIVKKTMDSASVNADNYLPSVMTCVNYFKLPDYSSVHILKEKLFKAMKDGQLSFHLS